MYRRRGRPIKRKDPFVANMRISKDLYVWILHEKQQNEAMNDTLLRIVREWKQTNGDK